MPACQCRGAKIYTPNGTRNIQMNIPESPWNTVNFEEDGAIRAERLRQVFRLEHGQEDLPRIKKFPLETGAVAKTLKGKY